MSDREKGNDYDDDDMNESRGGYRDGGVPDYEEAQSSPISDKDFDNSKTNWS